MNKHRILNALESTPSELNGLTVKELMTKLRAEISQEKSLQDDLELAVCSKFKGKYIKFGRDDGFGKSTMYAHIEDIRVGGFTDQNERLYEIKGNVITFSDYFTNSRDMVMGNSSDFKLAEELESSTIISKDFYDNAVEHLKLIKDVINKMNK